MLAHVRSMAPPALQGIAQPGFLAWLPPFESACRTFADGGYYAAPRRLCAFSSNEDDSRRVTYGEYLPGEFLGEMSLDGGLRSATVETVEDSWCVMVTRQTIEQHIAEHPGFAFELLAKVIRRARMATLSLRAVAPPAAPCRASGPPRRPARGRPARVRRPRGAVPPAARPPPRGPARRARGSRAGRTARRPTATRARPARGRRGFQRRAPAEGSARAEGSSWLNITLSCQRCSCM